MKYNHEKSKKSSCLLIKKTDENWWFAAEAMFRFNFHVEAEDESKDQESPSQPPQLAPSDQVNSFELSWTWVDNVLGNRRSHFMLSHAQFIGRPILE